MITNKPKDTEVEITLIGTGGGYGESIIIKLGIDCWIIVDSCINPFTNETLSLEYLNKIGVELSKVELIICTHWHNDHIKGLANVLSMCPNAEFCFSAVHDLNKFLYLCELDSSKTLKGGTINSTKEFALCMEIISKRNAYVTRAQSNLLLKSLEISGIKFELFALSPSPKTITNFESELSQLITEFGKRNTAIINKSPNEKSVALLLKFGEHRVILGADLEIGNDEHEGWKYVVKHSKVIDKNKADLYKIPHHGSENGYLKEIFDILVNDDSVLKLTPFKSSGLPKEQMMDTYSIHSKTIYITSNLLISKKAKKRDSGIEKVIDRSVISLTEVKFSHGLIRSRIDYSKVKSHWTTELFEAAVKY